ncbi:hypothetical protein [Corynebacterium casei]|uniref:hypothetical protein n=1 Tax=Corynebacterium casei TaxID=160386 RepID=UPI003F8DB105
MNKSSIGKHTYSVLIALVITAVAIPFSPGIPWIAWLGAFIVLLAVAEIAGTLMQSDDGKLKAQRQRQAIYFAAGAAVVILLLLIAWFI